MDERALEDAITDHAASLLLRYFSATEAARVSSPSIALERDRELLRLHWALSPAVSTLVSYILAHRHEIQSILSTARRVEDGIVRGRLDAVATLKQRRVSGMPTAVVSQEPLRSYDSGPNQVLGWVITQAWSLASRFVTLVQESSAYRVRIDAATQKLEQMRRIEGIRQISGHVAQVRRPRPTALLEAERSRRRLYHNAAAAYRALLQIEAGDPDAIVTMLRETLLAPLEPWRRYELAVGYSLADSLARELEEEMRLHFVVGDIRRPIAQAGRFTVFWQWRTDEYRMPKPEPSERITLALWKSYGLSAASDRPDLVVKNRNTGEVVSLIEVKYLTGESAADRVRSAAEQLVRYARGYADLDSIGPLLGRSLIAVSRGLDGLNPIEPLPDNTPDLLDFEGIKGGKLKKWGGRLARG